MKSSKNNLSSKKFKALILDVDGTLIPNKFEGMPSQKVKEAIADYIAPSVEEDGVADVINKFIL